MLLTIIIINLCLLVFRFHGQIAFLSWLSIGISRGRGYLYAFIVGFSVVTLARSVPHKIF